MIKSLKQLQQSAKYKHWKQTHKDHFLSHIFSFEPGCLQFGYSDKSAERITTFVVKQDSVAVSGEEEIFKQPETKLLPLRLERVKLSLEKALAKALAFQKSHYKEHEPQNQIVILQSLDIGQVYNITFVTKTLHTLNLKIHAGSGRVIEQKLTSLFDLCVKDEKDYIR
jgi:hypothetical protein